MEINFTQCTTIRKFGPIGTTGIAYKTIGGISRIWAKNQMMRWVKRMSHKSSGIPTMFVEKKIALPTCVNGFITKLIAAIATKLLPWLHLVYGQVVLMAEMLVLHCSLCFVKQELCNVYVQMLILNRPSLSQLRASGHYVNKSTLWIPFRTYSLELINVSDWNPII